SAHRSRDFDVLLVARRHFLLRTRPLARHSTVASRLRGATPRFGRRRRARPNRGVEALSSVAVELGMGVAEDQEQLISALQRQCSLLWGRLRAGRTKVQ